MIQINIVLVVIVTLMNSLYSCDNKGVIESAKTNQWDMVLWVIVNVFSGTVQQLAERSMRINVKWHYTVFIRFSIVSKLQFIELFPNTEVWGISLVFIKILYLLLQIHWILRLFTSCPTAWCQQRYILAVAVRTSGSHFWTIWLICHIVDILRRGSAFSHLLYRLYSHSLPRWSNSYKYGSNKDCGEIMPLK